ncbi:hypothetical protein OG607_38725 [Streptomyces sp. NBC_01537]|uniref:hypothetical protein n=1 Tax=Streptomyces sp. NBC_01537 TaxID=2903896 RepID=UPI00386909FF
MPDVTEIRVHGVSGTPPEDLLQIQPLRQVDGDDTARFLRRSRAPQEPPVREAFHWGSMTSGSVSKALWLLLAPFGVLNLSRYTLPMAPGDTSHRAARRTADAALRLLGLVLTVLLTTAVAFVAIDLVAWQCGGSARCTSANAWLPFSGRTTWAWRLPLGAAGPALLIALLTWFGRQVYLYPPPGAGAPEPWPDAVGALDQEAFWATSPRAPMLRVFHTTAATAVVVMLVAHLTIRPVAGLRKSQDWADNALWVLFLAAAVIALVCAVLTLTGHHPRAPQWDPTGRDTIAIPPWCLWQRRLAWAMLLATVVIAAVFGAHADPRGVSRRPVHLSGFDWAFGVLYAGSAVLLLVLLGATVLLRTTLPPADEVPRPFRALWGGLACPAIAGFAVLLATGFTSGLALQTARLLGRLVEPAESAGSTKDHAVSLVLPDLIHVTALLWAAVVAAAVLLAAAVTWRRFRPELRLDYTARIHQDYAPGEPGNRTTGRIAGSWSGAALKYRLPSKLAWLGTAGFLAAVVQGGLGWYAVLPGPDRSFDWIQDHLYRYRFFGVADDIGAWALTGLAAGLAFLGVRAFRSPQWRRRTGILWDLLAFWPRLAHPIVPPPYGGRAVLALAQRVRDKAQDGGKVVLSGHSQGSLICAATAMLLGRDTPSPLPRLALLTHGSQLMWAYPRLFPAYAGHRRLRELYEAGLDGRWRNLHRWTDPLGGPVLAAPTTGPVGPVLPESVPWQAIDGAQVNASTPVAGDGHWLRRLGPEIQLRDPAQVTAAADTPVSPLRGHSSYYADPAYDVVVTELLGLIADVP